jgi:hypothetical protein
MLKSHPSELSLSQNLRSSGLPICGKFQPPRQPRGPLGRLPNGCRKLATWISFLVWYLYHANTYDPAASFILKKWNISFMGGIIHGPKNYP